MTQPSSYELAILMALQQKHIYGGTVLNKQFRRAKGKAAKAARKKNR